MNELLPYIIKSTLCLSLLYLAFRTAMRKEAYFALNRMVLIAVVIFSFIIPQLYLPSTVKPIIKEQIIPQFPVYNTQMQPMEVIENDETIISVPSPVTVQPEKLLPYSTGQIIFFIYMAGILFSFIIFIHSIGNVLLMLRKAKAIKKDGILTFILEKDIPAFSFWKMIFISRADYLEHGPTILSHEQQHIRLGHFYDLLLMEMAKMVHWFNPFIYWLVQDLKAIHEFQADKSTLTKGIDARKYQLLIIEKGVGHQKLALANSFNHCQIKKRITMMNQSKIGRAWRWKVATFLPLLALLLMAFGRSDEKEPPEEGILSPLEIIVQQDSVKQWTEADFKVFTKKNKEEVFFEGKTFVIIQIDADSKITVDDESLTLNEIPDQIQKWIDYNYAEQKEHINFWKQTINEQVKMSPTTVITVRKDPKTPHEDYLKLLNVVANTVLKVRGDYSNEIFKTPYTKLSVNQRKDIDRLIPMNVAVTNAELKKFEIATPPPPPPFKIEIRKDGSYINNRLFSLEDIGKKAEGYQKSNPNAVVSIKVDKDVPQERVNEVKEVLRSAKAQNINISIDKPEDHIYLTAEIMPEFPGGESGLKKYIAENVKYPSSAVKANVQGKVFVAFIIDSQGTVTNPKVVRSINPELDAEAIRVVSMMPKWIPAKEKGKNVRMSYTIPINFVLSPGPSGLIKKDAAPTTSSSSSESSSIVGTWKLVSYNYGGGDELNPVSPGSERIKYITEKNFNWVQYAGKDKIVVNSAGGTYTFSNNTYTEKIAFGAQGMASYIGKEHKFHVIINNNKLELSGELADGLKIKEVWERYQPSDQSSLIAPSSTKDQAVESVSNLKKGIAPPPPPPRVKNKGLEIIMDGENILVNNQRISMEELEKKINGINNKDKFVEIITNSRTNKSIETKIKDLLEKQDVTYRIARNSKW